MSTITTSASKELKQTCLRILFLCICSVNRFFLEFLLYLFRLRICSRGSLLLISLLGEIELIEFFGLESICLSLFGLVNVHVNFS